MNRSKENDDRLVLVTGGAGYKGSTLCRELLFRGYRVRVLDCLMYGGRPLSGLFNHDKFEFVRGDVTVRQDVEAAMDGVTDVIHLAAIVGDKPCECDPQRSIEINYYGTQILAEAARKKKVGHFLFASSCSNYGITDSATPIKEDGELNPVSLYAETKIDCERYLENAAKTGDFFPVMLRFSTAFGVSGRTRFDLIVNSFTYEALRDKRIIVYAEEGWRPFLHVLDIARIYCRMLELPKEGLAGQIYNAGWNEQNYTKRQIVQFILDVLGEFEVDRINTVEDKRSYRVDFFKIEKLLGITPLKTVKDGVAEIAAAIRTGLLTEQDFENNKLK
ncbi:MAG: NAD(P)-dependent oxidoreductase [Smithella sp.]|nr:NAD(P)-dependent oxidoreductase [Smithella sp.]